MNYAQIYEFFIAMLYLVGSITYLGGLLFRKDKVRRLAIFCTGCGFGLHTVDLIMLFAGLGHQNFSQTQFYFSLLAWAFILIFFFVWWKMRLEFLALVSSPLALILYSSSLAVSSSKLPVPKMFSSLWFGLHIGSIFVSMVLMAFACGSGVVYLYLENRIKRKAGLGSFFSDLPSLTAFDRMNNAAVLWGFPLYTLGVLSGFVWAAFTWKKFFSWDPKEIVSLLIWVGFAYIFHQRLAFNWKGRKPARAVVILFVLMVISMVGINFLIPTHHSFKP